MVKRIFVLVPLFLLFSFVLGPSRQTQAYVKVSSFQEFQVVCREQKQETIELLQNILIEEPVIIRGDKKIDGNGFRLERSGKKGSVYGGCLFVVKNGSCLWENVTVSGGGKSKNVIGKVFGRLVEIRQGTMIIGENCVFCDNVNDRLAVDGGGAIQIGSKGNCIMKAGEIRNNEIVSKGAGFLVEKGGCLTVKGGSIRDNQVTGVGAVKGFDGRGGAIYCEGKVSIEGGTIIGNRAVSYQQGKEVYGGMGGAVYVESGAALYVGGGAFRANQDRKKSAFWIQGGITLSGKPTLERIYLATGVHIKTYSSFFPKKEVILLPQRYKMGLCLTKGKQMPFKLVTKTNYQLEKRRDGCYIGKVVSNSAKEKERKKEMPKSVSSAIHTSSLKKEEKPRIFCKKTHFVFYVGELVKRETMLYGIRALDSKDGDITAKVNIISPQTDNLSTDREGCGQIIYGVKNRRGVGARRKVTYQIRKNHSPVVQTAPRFLFLTEVAGYTKQQWKNLLLQGCHLVDDQETSADLRDSTTVDIREIKDKGAGTWEVLLEVQDQYGHRFYMRKGERKRYGKGRRTYAKISVTLVDYSDLGQEDAGYVRFVEPGTENHVEEEWHFSAEQVEQIRGFMDARENPFDQSTNLQFLRTFGACKRHEEVLKYE